jgi:MFS family permease
MEAAPQPSEQVTIRSVLGDASVRTVILVAFIVMVGFGAALPIMPLYARELGASYAAAGLFTSAFGFTRLFTDLIAGPLVDRHGERKMASAGLALLACSTAVAGIAPNFGLAVGFWAVGGVGSAVMFAAQFSYLLKAVPSRQMARTMGVFYGSFNAGILTGGVVGGVVADLFGLSAPIFMYSTLLAVAVLVYWKVVPDPPRRNAAPALTPEEALVEREMPVTRKGRTALGTILRTPGFVTTIVVNFAYMWMVVSIFDTLVPLFGKEEIGMTTVGIGMVFAVTIAAEFTVLYQAGSWADRFGRKKVMVPSLLALTVITPLIGFASTPIELGLIMGVLGFASGTAGVPPAAMLSDVVPEEHSGTGVGTFRFAGDLSFFLGPLAVGVTTEAFGFKAAFPVAAIPLLLALVLVMRTRETMELRAERTGESLGAPHAERLRGQ